MKASYFFKIESKRRDLVEQNEVMMSLLRVLYEDMQKVHRHSSGGQVIKTALSMESNAFNYLNWDFDFNTC